MVTAFRHDIPYSIHQCFAIITGLIIEAIPFLLLGTVGSTIIRYFVPQRVLLKLLGDHSLKSYGAAMVSGFALPICDCAIIPLFKALIDRGIPLSVALLFMLASPIINPITILSTWYAFPDNPMLSVWRIVLGLGVALLVALSFRFWPPATSILKARTPQNLSYEEIVLETTKTKYIDKKRLLIHMEQEFSPTLILFLHGGNCTIYSSSVWQALASQRRINLARIYGHSNFADVSILLLYLLYIRCHYR